MMGVSVMNHGSATQDGVHIRRVETLESELMGPEEMAVRELVAIETRLDTAEGFLFLIVVLLGFLAVKAI